MGHTAPAAWAGCAKQAMALFGSSSPSYLTLQSLDACNAALAGEFPPRLARFVEKMAALRGALAAHGVPLLNAEPLKLTVDAAAMGYSGGALAELLRQAGGECEFADGEYLAAMLTPDNPDGDLELLGRFLTELPRRAPLPRRSFRAPVLTRACSIREAVLSRGTPLPPEEAVGRVCASPAVSCPPAVPIAVSGEVIDEYAAGLFTAYGIDSVDVVDGL